MWSKHVWLGLKVENTILLRIAPSLGAGFGSLAWFGVQGLGSLQDRRVWVSSWYRYCFTATELTAFQTLGVSGSGL